MLRKQLTVSLVTLLCAGFLTACDGVDPELVGTWALVDESDGERLEQSFEFRGNGDFVASSGGASASGKYDAITDSDPKVLVLEVRSIEGWVLPPFLRYEDFNIYEIIDEGSTLRLGYYFDSSQVAPSSFDEEGVFELFYSRQ